MGKIRVLIVGAGPVGLTAALFLSSNPSVQVDIIEQSTKKRNMQESKALAINPRTMTILTGYSSQARLLDLAIKVDHFKLKNDGKSMFQNNIRQILESKTKFPHIFIYPQHSTEKVIEEELNSKGIVVRRGVRLDKIIRNQPNDVVVSLSDSSSQQDYHIVLGADGARSSIRKMLQLPFPGETLEQQIFIADYEVEGEGRKYFQVSFGNPHFLIIIPVNGKVVRLIGNFPQLMQHTQKVTDLKLGKKVWNSQFKLNNRCVDQMNVGSVYLAGDAAHVHAPIGGRGMNLGIEDAFIFAELLKNNRLEEYSSLRVPVVKNFVQVIKKASKNLEYKKTLLRSVLPYIAPVMNYFTKNSMIEFVAGIDHQIPFLPKL